MKKRVFVSVLAAAAILGSMSAWANGGTGMEADPTASLDTYDKVVYCVDDIQLKEYIKDSDPVINTYKAGTIFNAESRLYRDGKEVDWATTETKNEQYGGLNNGFFELGKVKPYGGKEDFKVTIDENKHDMTIRVAAIAGEEYVYASSNIDALESKGDEMVDGDFVVHMHAKDDFNEDVTVTLTGYVNGKKYDVYTVNVYGIGEIGFANVTIAPLKFEEIKDEIDHEQELALDDGTTEKVYFLKDGRVIDMNGYQAIAIADNGWQGHDGRILKEKQ